MTSLVELIARHRQEYYGLETWSKKSTRKAHREKLRRKGARFLVKEEGVWYDIGNDEIRRIVVRRLREGSVQLRFEARKRKRVEHAVANKATAKDWDMVYHRVLGTGHLLAMLSPWYDPEYLKRAWCIFELYTASTDDSTTVTLAMARSEKEHLKGLIKKEDTNAFERMAQTIANTKFENAKASHDDDKQNVMRIIDQGPGQAAVDNMLRQWTMHIIMEQIRTIQQDREKGLPENPGHESLSDKEFAIFLVRARALFRKMGDEEKSQLCQAMIDSRNLKLKSLSSTDDARKNQCH